MWPQRYILLGRWGSHSDRKPRLSCFPPLQPGSYADLGGWEGQAAAPSSVGPMGADTSNCRVPSLVLSHSALLIGDD